MKKKIVAFDFDGEGDWDNAAKDGLVILNGINLADEIATTDFI